MHSSSEETCDPNLIPLLDLVLQLVMFFIIVSNFAESETVEVNLPYAVSARPPDPGEVENLYLILNSKGAIVVPNRGEISSVAEIRYHLVSEFATAKRAAEAKGSTEVNSVVVVRADRDSDFKPIYEILREAKSAGFRKWQLRTFVKNK